MSLDAQLNALTLPAGTEFPGTPQELLELIEQYMEITGLNPFNGINFGSTTPSADNRDRPWFQTSGGGEPIGWFSWDGSAWSPIPLALPSGPSADRPVGVSEGTQYFDTDISVALIFERAQWRTLSGSPNDTKFVKAGTIEQALYQNPGWVQDPDSQGRVIGCVGSGPGLTERTYGEAVGAEEVTLSEANLPTHTHVYQGQATPARWYADGNVANAAGNLAGYAANGDLNTSAVGDQTPVAIMNPVIYYHCLLKL